MALIPSAAYPGQIAVDANYPQGKARNVTVSGDGTGTPLEQKWVNDVWGFLQALLAAGNVTPSGTPDSVAASDYLTALQNLFANYVVFTFNNAATAASAFYALTSETTHGPGFTLTGGNTIQVPVAGTYKVSWQFVCTSPGPFLGLPCDVQVAGSSFTGISSFASADASPVGCAVGSRLVVVTTPGTQTIKIKNSTSGSLTPPTGAGRFMIERVN